MDLLVVDHVNDRIVGLSNPRYYISKNSLIIYQTITPSNKALSDVLKNNPDKLEASQGKLIPILVQAIKDLKKEIDELKKA